MERYYITGVQLGMLIAIKEEAERNKIVNEIIDKQFIASDEESDWGCQALGQDD